VSVARFIDARAIAPRPWRNGGGQTRELVTWPPDGAAWQMRISVADVVQDGTFSAYPGVQRWFAVVAGAGVVLRLGAGEGSDKTQERHLDAQSAPLQFAGATPVDCSLMDGPTIDLNLMVTDGGRGEMIALSSGVSWTCGHRMGGLFTRVAGRLAIAGRGSRQVTGQTLCWLDDARGAGLRFEALGPAEGPPAIALAFSPAD